jgi:HK97 family phage portal protein
LNPSYSVVFNSAGEPSQPDDLARDLTVEERAWFAPSDNQWPMNFWQMGMDSTRSGAKSTNPVYACRKVLAEEVSRLPLGHYRLEADGGQTKLRTAISRVLRFPNSYQSAVSFWLNMVDTLITDGNAYATVGRDARGAVSSLTWRPNGYPYVDPQTGQIFYGFGVDSRIPEEEGGPDPMFLVPADEVLHLRLFTPVHPLIGEPPLVAAALSAMTGQAMSNSSYAFFNKAARPAGYLRHPRTLKAETKARLKDAWTRNYSGEGTGGVAVLEEGVDWVPLTMTAVDSDLVDQYKLTVEDVARVYRVPLFMLGDMSKATFANVEQMTRTFYAGGLGFYVRLIEEELARFFGLQMDEFIEFDVERGLMRTEFRDRVEAITRGIQGGLFTVNEGRRRERLPSKEYGDEPMLQQQMVPLSYAAQQQQPDPEPSPQAEDDVEPEEIRALIRRELKVAA